MFRHTLTNCQWATSKLRAIAPARKPLKAPYGGTSTILGILWPRQLPDNIHKRGGPGRHNALVAASSDLCLSLIPVPAPVHTAGCNSDHGRGGNSWSSSLCALQSSNTVMIVTIIKMSPAIIGFGFMFLMVSHFLTIAQVLQRLSHSLYSTAAIGDRKALRCRHSAYVGEVMPSGVYDYSV